MYKVDIKLYDFEDRVVYEKDNMELPFLPRIGEKFMYIMSDYFTHEMIYDWEKDKGVVRVADLEHEYNENNNKYQTNITLAFSYDPRFRDHFWQSTYEKEFGNE